MGVTDDPNDPRLTRGGDPADGGPVPQAEVYLVMPTAERSQFVRPLRASYWHETCGAVTTMSAAIAETYAANPRYYGYTYCTTCRHHLPVGPNGEFYWCDENGRLPDDPRTAPKVGT